MNMNFLGIDLSVLNVKVALLSKQHKAFSILELKEYPIPKYNTEEEWLKVHEAIFIQIINDFPSAHIVRVLGVDYYPFLRKLSFPFSQKFKILKNVPFQLEDELPTPVENLIFDAKIISKKEKSYEAIILATNKELIQRFSALCEQTQMDIETLTAKDFSLGKITPPGEDRCYLNLSYEQSNLNFIKYTEKENITTHCIKLNWSPKALSQNLAKNYNLSSSKVRENLNKKSFILKTPSTSPDQNELSEIIKFHIKKLSDEISLKKKTLKYEGVNINELYLYGELASIKNLSEFIQASTKIPTHMSADFLVDMGAQNNPHRLKYVTAVSLAVDGEHPTQSFNFLKSEFSLVKKKIRKFYTKTQSLMKGVAALWIIFTLFGIAKERIAITNSDAAHSRLRSIAKKATPLKGRKINSKNINKFIKNYKVQKNNRNFFSELSNTKTSMKIFHSLSVSIIKDLNINIRKLRISQKAIFLQGEALKLSDIAQLKMALRNMSPKQNIHSLKNAHKVQKGFLPFNFKVIL